MPYIRTVVDLKCPYCQSSVIKFGKFNNRQRYRCKRCERTFLYEYQKKAYEPMINSGIVSFIKEGCGIRSIARLLCISSTTVIRCIGIIAGAIQKPSIETGRMYEVDELRTFIGNKRNECWVIYALDKMSGQVADVKVGSRNNKNLNKIIATLLLSDCRKIYTDKLCLYRQLIPPTIHRTRRYGTNQIERKNLCLRTSLKRLGRKTICYSKSLFMLEACLKIYF